MRINLPNQITIGRFVLTVIFLVLLSSFDFAQREQSLWKLDVAFILFVIAAGTDWLDGYLARKHNQVTSFGRILDPFVDKILLVGALVLLLGHGFRDAHGEDVTGLRAWMVVVIISRELLVSGLRGFSEAQGKPYAANWWGKSKMVLQSITVGWLIASVGRLRGIEWVMEGRPIVIWVMVLFTAASVVAYLFASREALAEQAR
ncbi:MAG TPA: CDP-diacylglycerol--glycerol-3-phosphate 3-phosphatidyltransferase [Phycisphaerae bacterium]|nr:CDP-diacylglycerol--glycerol-3-phosphate 3-phosphatidyltransferase [Phycisphaerae bacterium]